MLSIVYLMLFLSGGAVIARLLLPRLKPVLRVYLGLSLGVLLLMWLPVLWAYAVRFSYAAHWLALGTLALLVGAAWLWRDCRAPAPFDETEKRTLRLLLVLVVPLTVLGGYLQYTHSIRLAADGTYHVGQSTYGDLSLHLAVCTSIVNASFPLENSLMLGATMAYPYLSDSIATSMLMLGMPAQHRHGLHGHDDDGAGLRRLRAFGHAAVQKARRGGAGVFPAVSQRRSGLFLYAGCYRERL